ncbi:hypothetical protein TrRE_jg11720 [Triparma retinervis]|uniref:Uncharacterized protein n=1 Tax=Triparma retinervis TaxID=2557542 RepID=A0A9W7EG86_9STRA|nr:hypothetical protein TrRE_jg11720 [Triparma retinervis]
MTNSSMRYVNYPVKTLMKSSRVIFTMLFGSIIMRKRHRKSDYAVVVMMVSGLAFFIHAETMAKNDQHAFSFVGIGMLVMSLLADGAVVNLNEKIMNVHNLGQDELIFLLYSLAALFMFFMTVITGELSRGLTFVLTDGSLQGEELPSFTSREKVLSTLVFITMGFLGSSCAGAITKHFGALSMSITSTARKATTLFLSFLLFPKVCTFQHLVGMAVFVLALVVKSFASHYSTKKKNETILPFHNNATQPNFHRQ